MSLVKSVVNTSLKGVSRLLCRVDDEQLRRVPLMGPLIIVSNHINFIEVPLIYTHMQPRPLTGFAKAETWDNPIMALLFNLWEAIPIRRGEADLEAMRQAVGMLKSGGMVAVAPEGTRSNDGQLQQGHPGIVLLAQLSGAPLLPIGYYGSERLHENIKKLQRTDFHIVVGQPFTIDFSRIKMSRQVRQEITDEIMYELAAILPPAYRGCYSDLSSYQRRYILFQEEEKTHQA
jgi:1-acyl-sn-glycerol-3-phosphate acyltransferase